MIKVTSGLCFPVTCVYVGGRGRRCSDHTAVLGGWVTVLHSDPHGRVCVWVCHVFVKTRRLDTCSVRGPPRETWAPPPMSP